MLKLKACVVAGSEDSSGKLHGSVGTSFNGVSCTTSVKMWHWLAGERLSPWVAIACIAMGVSILVV